MPVSFYSIDIYHFLLCLLHMVGSSFSSLLTSSLKSMYASCNIIAFSQLLLIIGPIPTVLDFDPRCQLAG